MFEYDIETILRILKIEEFELDNLDLNQIKQVPIQVALLGISSLIFKSTQSSLLLKSIF